MEVGTLLEEARTRMRERYLLPSPGKRRTLRQRSGLAQSDLARLLGVTASAVSRYETGERTPRPEVLHLYLELLGQLESALKDEGPTSLRNATLPRAGGGAPTNAP